MRAFLVLALLATTAHADRIELPKTKATLDLPATWTKLPDDASLVVAYKSPTGAILAVTRGTVPNASAWIPGSKAAYAAEIAKGALAAVPGAKQLASKLGEANGIPAFDLELRRPDGTTTVTRILLYRSYALACAIEVPKGGSLDEARAITGKFAPPKS